MVLLFDYGPVLYEWLPAFDFGILTGSRGSPGLFFMTSASCFGSALPRTPLRQHLAGRSAHVSVRLVEYMGLNESVSLPGAAKKNAHTSLFQCGSPAREQVQCPVSPMT